MSSTILIKGRRLLCLCLAIFMFATLSACGQSTSDSASLPSSQPSMDEPEHEEAVDDEPEYEEPVEEEPQYPEGFSVLLTNTTGFSEGLAWIQYTDENLNLVISVDEYPDNYIYCRPFYGDYTTMEIRGADGKKYLTVIDKNGKQMFEPMTYQGYYPRMLDGYLLVQNDAGEYAIYDHNGQYIHTVDKDFPDCTVSIEMFYRK